MDSSKNIDGWFQLAFLTSFLELLTVNLALTSALNMAPAILLSLVLFLVRRKAGRFKPFIDTAAIIAVTIGAMNTGNVLISYFENVSPENLMVTYLIATESFEAFFIYPAESLAGFALSQLLTLLTQYSASVLHTFILWAFVALFSALLGVFTLLIRLLVFERRLGGSFKDRAKAVVFTKIPANPLDEVSGVSVVKDYLVIGLVTLPAIVSFSLTLENYYNMGIVGGFGLNIAIYIMLLYRFSYLTSSRLAKIGGVKCGDVDLGEKLMRNVVGPFTYFNVILSLAGIGNIAYGLLTQRHIYVALQFLRHSLIVDLTAQDPILGLVASALIPSFQQVNVYMLLRITLANTASIVFAVVLLPLFEKFALNLYHKAYFLMVSFQERIRELRGGDLAEAVALGVSLGAFAFIAFYAILSMASALTTGTYDLSLASTIIYYALTAYPHFSSLIAQQGLPALSLSPSPLTPLSIWVLSTVLVAMTLKLLIGGAAGYLATREVKPEWIAFTSALVAAVALWSIPSVSTPLVGYASSYVATPVGVLAVNRPVITLPETMEPASYLSGNYLFAFIIQMAYMAFFDLPIWVLSTALIAYIAYYAKPAEAPVVKPVLEKVVAPARVELFKLTLRDVALSSVAFTVGLAVTTLAAFALYYLTGFTAVWLFRAVIFEVAAPEGVEYLLYVNYTLIPQLVASLIHVPSWVLENNLPIILTHNLNRCILSAIGALVFWTVVAGIHAASKGRTSGIEWYILGAGVFAAEYLLFDDQFTPIAMLAIPITAAAAYKLARREAHFTSTLIKASLYSLCTLEILSTAFVIAGLYMIESVSFIWLGGKGGYPYLVSILPHGIIEIPAAILATAIGLSVARRLSSAADKPDIFLEQAKNMLKSRSLAVTLLAAIAMFTTAAVIEAYISPQIYWSTFPLLAATVG
ncbi:MAG: stage II sporulation protein M [Candidatus Jordarchaeales archaeon]